MTARPQTWNRPSFWYYVVAVNAGVIAGFWLQSSGYQAVRSQADLFNAGGRVTGLWGTYLVLWQLLMMARVPWLEEAFGLERLAWLHRLGGYLALSLLVAHAVLQTIGYELGDGLDPIRQLGDFISHYEGLLAAIVGLLLMVAVVGVSIAVARRRFSYETWYFIHLYAYIAVLLAFSHQLATGIDFIGQPAFVAYWITLYVLVIAALLWFRLITPLRVYGRHRFFVHSVVKEAPGVHSVRVRGRGLRGFPVESGQFLIWRFLDRKRWWQAHPFSLSAPADGRELRLTVKNSGDFTARIPDLRPGTPVLIEGPFGKFTEQAATGEKMLLVAGGVGITPLRSLAETLARQGRDVVLLYRARREQDLIFRRELDRLAAEQGVSVRYLLSEARRDHRPGPAWFQPESLLGLVPDLSEREIYLCGPASMTADFRRVAAGLGVPPAHLHVEVFRY